MYVNAIPLRIADLLARAVFQILKPYAVRKGVGAEGFEGAEVFVVEQGAVEAEGGGGGGVDEVGGFVAGDLDLAGVGDALADDGGGLAGYSVVGELAEIDERHLDMDVDAIEKGGTDLLADRAAALSL